MKSKKKFKFLVNFENSLQIGENVKLMKKN